MIAGALGGGHLALIVVGALIVVRVGVGATRRRRMGTRQDDGGGGRPVPADGAAPKVVRRTAPPSPTQVGEPVLDVRDLTVTYGPKRAVDGVSFAIGRGEIFGLLGPNGAGKTSTLSAIEGLVRPRTGTIEIDGLDVWHRPIEAKRKLGVQLQATSFQSELTIREIVRLYAGLYGIGLTDDEILERLRSSGLGDDADRPFKHLSGGQQQRLSLLVALLHEPVLLLLDEPTTSLDPQSRRQLWSRIEHIRDGGGSILLTTHSMEEAQAVCERVAIIDYGTIVAIDAPSRLVEEHRDDPRALAVARGEVTLEDVFIALTGSDIRE